MAKTASDDKTGRVAWGKRLIAKVTCPNCWHQFVPEDVLFVGKHPDLPDDPVLTGNEIIRFPPTRFTVKGEALDPRGVPSSDIACPRCHLQISEALLEVPPLFVSMIGSPASGKSYLLTTMTWQLRSLLPRAGLAFSDADPIANSPIHEYEHTLFLNPQRDRPTEIRKTDPDDPRLYKMAAVDGVPIRFPLPLQFLVWPTPEHPSYAMAYRVGRVIVLYDNSGEDFRPGMEDVRSAAIQHLARSAILFMLLDPTQEPRLREFCRADDPQLTQGLRPGTDAAAVTLRQETILKEAAVRMRRYLGVSQTQRFRKPLVVIVPKFDILEGLSGISIKGEPYSGLNDGDTGPVRLKVADVEWASAVLRKVLQQYCPEFVATAESLSEIVTYIPVSSFGRSPEFVRGGNQSFYGIRPRDIRPQWVTVPLLYCMSKWGQLVLASTDRRQ